MLSNTFQFFASVVLCLGCGWVCADSVTSYRELRYETVVGQTEWFTCGPAALSTLLTEFYGLEDAGELKLLELAIEAMEGTDRDIEETGVTALALKQVAETKGVATRGFQVTMEELSGYFASGGLPLLIHVTGPELHYVIAIGMIGFGGDWHVVLADPSFGRRILPFSSLVYEKGFSGVVLVTDPGEEALLRAQQVQAEVLQWASQRLRRLGSL